MKYFKKGEIATTLTIGAFIFIAASSVISSFFVNNNQQTSLTSASENRSTWCTQYPNIPAPGPNYYWEADCGTPNDAGKSCYNPDTNNPNVRCPPNSNPAEVGNPDAKYPTPTILGYVNKKTSNWCYGFGGPFGDTRDFRCLKLRYGTRPVDPQPSTPPAPPAGSVCYSAGQGCVVSYDEGGKSCKKIGICDGPGDAKHCISTQVSCTSPTGPTATLTPTPTLSTSFGGACNKNVKDIYFDNTTRICTVLATTADGAISCSVRKSSEFPEDKCSKYLGAQSLGKGEYYYKFQCDSDVGVGKSGFAQVGALDFATCKHNWQDYARWEPLVHDPAPVITPVDDGGKTGGGGGTTGGGGKTGGKDDQKPGGGGHGGKPGDRGEKAKACAAQDTCDKCIAMPDCGWVTKNDSNNGPDGRPATCVYGEADNKCPANASYDSFRWYWRKCPSLTDSDLNKKNRLFCEKQGGKVVGGDVETSKEKGGKEKKVIPFDVTVPEVWFLKPCDPIGTVLKNDACLIYNFLTREDATYELCYGDAFTKCRKVEIEKTKLFSDGIFDGKYRFTFTFYANSGEKLPKSIRNSYGEAIVADEDIGTGSTIESFFDSISKFWQVVINAQAADLLEEQRKKKEEEKGKIVPPNCNPLSQWGKAKFVEKDGVTFCCPGGLYNEAARPADDKACDSIRSTPPRKDNHDTKIIISNPNSMQVTIKSLVVVYDDLNKVFGNTQEQNVLDSNATQKIGANGEGLFTFECKDLVKLDAVRVSYTIKGEYEIDGKTKELENITGRCGNIDTQNIEKVKIAKIVQGLTGCDACANDSKFECVPVKTDSSEGYCRAKDVKAQCDDKNKVGGYSCYEGKRIYCGNSSNTIRNRELVNTCDNLGCDSNTAQCKKSTVTRCTENKIYSVSNPSVRNEKVQMCCKMGELPYEITSSKSCNIGGNTTTQNTECVPERCDDLPEEPNYLVQYFSKRGNAAGTPVYYSSPTCNPGTEIKEQLETYPQEFVTDGYLGNLRYGGWCDKQLRSVTFKIMIKFPQDETTRARRLNYDENKKIKIFLEEQKEGTYYSLDQRTITKEELEAALQNPSKPFEKEITYSINRTGKTVKGREYVVNDKKYKASFCFLTLNGGGNSKCFTSEIDFPTIKEPVIGIDFENPDVSNKKLDELK